MAGIKCKVVEVMGSVESVQASITAALGSISVASGTVPSVAIFGTGGIRQQAIIIYSEA